MPHPRRRLPLISLGILLILITCVPIIIGMTRGFNQLERGEDPSAAVDTWTNVASHPAFIAFISIGMLLIMAGLLRLLLHGVAGFVRSIGRGRAGPRQNLTRS
jgi:uncharacterized membrane protein